MQVFSLRLLVVLCFAARCALAWSRAHRCPAPPLPQCNCCVLLPPRLNSQRILVIICVFLRNGASSQTISRTCSLANADQNIRTRLCCRSPCVLVANRRPAFPCVYLCALALRFHCLLICFGLTSDSLLLLCSGHRIVGRRPVLPVSSYSLALPDRRLRVRNLTACARCTCT